MKLFNAEQIKSWDAYTIQNEGINSLELMERASETFVNWFAEQFPDKTVPVYVFCGNGNNGGDGLAISRLLHQKSYNVNVIVLPLSDRRSIDNQTNLNAVQKIDGLKTSTLTNGEDFPSIPNSSIIIDALFGTGLNNELHGLTQDLVYFLNQLNTVRVAVDIPSGLFADKPSTGAIFNADYTFSFEQPKLAFLFPENHKYVGRWIVKSIHLSEEYYLNESTDNFLLTNEVALSHYKKRGKFEHKGSFGHAILIVGSKGKIGAAVLSTFACMRSGSGLTTVYTPSCGYEILQTSIPEAMVITDSNESYIGSSPKTDPYDAVGIGCGLGMENETQKVLGELLNTSTKPIVLDADALNIIASNPEMLNEIPENSILTPHPKEFERLFGKTSNDFERTSLQRQKAMHLKCFILLKGAHSCIATPDGICYYNSTGNPGMATAGSGDVLTGIITGLLAQGYSSKAALALGVYLHGLAGDLAAKELSEDSLMARDLIKYLPKAFLKMTSASTFES
jgi:NAD(P)H-hydrate epimerase